jgi:hypothetical protein
MADPGFAAASTSNAQLEGDDGYAADAATATVRLGNVCQISRKTPRVTGTQQAVDHAGRGNEMDYQVMLKGMELKRDIEAILTGANQAKVTGNSLDRAEARGRDCPGSRPTPSRAAALAPIRPRRTVRRSACDSATQRAFVENDLKSALKKAYDAGGRPNKILMGSFNKQAFSMFTGRGTPTQDAPTRRSRRRLTCTCRTSANSEGGSRPVHADP